VPCVCLVDKRVMQMRFLDLDHARCSVGLARNNPFTVVVKLGLLGWF